MGDGKFEIRSLYYFRQRLSADNLKPGINLLEKAFERITDQQIMELKIRTGQQRMDSTQIASNILDASRLHLLVAGVQRLHRLLKPEDQERLTTWLTPFIQDTAGDYAYRVKGKVARQEQLEKVGQTLFAGLVEMRATYEKQAVDGLVARLFQTLCARRRIGNYLRAVCNHWMIWKRPAVPKAPSTTRAMSPISPKPVIPKTNCS